MKITIKINTAADKLANCIARARAILDALDANTARMPEGSELQLPPGLPPLPPVPEGYHRWVYRGMGWKKEQVMYAYVLGSNMDKWRGNYFRQSTSGLEDCHYIEAIKEEQP